VSTPPDTAAVTIVGAGIVGIATACWLIRRGIPVTVIDRDEPGNGCSFGNAGGICPGSCVPLAMPGMLKKVPGWLLDPEGPLFVRLAYLPRALPWLIRFVRAGDRARVLEIADAMRALHAPTIERYRTLVEWAGCPELMVERGQLFLYETAEELKGDGFGLHLRWDRGVKVEILEKNELRQLEPALAPIFEKAVYLPEQAQCLNPHRLVRALAERFVADGGRIERARIDALDSAEGRITHLVSDRGDLPVETLVVAAGAWSGRLLKTVGIRVPLEAERGYHITVAEPDVMPRLQAMWCRRKFVVTPQETGVRFAGTDEFAGLDAPPDERRARILLRHGKTLVPGLGEVPHATAWMGHRPGTPDSLPVIGRDTRYANLLHAFGHGHTGLMGASVTGHLIGEILGGEEPSIDLTPYRVDRF
jgi:D-amino-acid dehydrogenase